MAKSYAKFYVDQNTKNQSFLDQSRSLLGTNREFMLTTSVFKTVHDAVTKIDPFDPNLSDDDRSNVSNAASNVWYFLRECVRVWSDEVKDYIPFQLNAGTMAQIFLIDNNIDSYLSLPRGFYKTISALVALSRGQKRVSVMELAGVKDHLKTSIKIPSYLYTSNYMTYNVISCNEVRSTMDAIKLVCEGSQVHFYNDFEYLNNIDTFYPATFTTRESYPTGSQIKPLRVMSSSYGNENSEGTKFAKALIEQCVEWDDRLYDLDAEQLRMYLKITRPIGKKYSVNNNIFYIRKTYKELGKDSKWLGEQIKLLDYRESAIARDLILVRETDPNYRDAIMDTILFSSPTGFEPREPDQSDLD